VSPAIRATRRTAARSQAGAAARRAAGAGVRQRGQASVELLAALPFVLIAALLCLQLLATGYSLTLADGAAEAGALALAADRPPGPAVEAALPGWARDRVDLERVGGRVTVRLHPPSPLAVLGRALEVSSSAWVRRPEAAG
jgi:hypothetical protein